MRRKPPDYDLITAIQRVQRFSFAFAERHIIQQIQENVLPIPVRGSICFQSPRDQRVLEQMLQLAKGLPSVIDDGRLDGILLITLWLAECSVTALGALLEGEVAMSHPGINQKRVYKAKFPTCLYPAGCLHCGGLLSGNPTQKFCKDNCHTNWITLKQQFARISKLVNAGESVEDEYGTVLNAYCLFIHNPNYQGYQVRNPEVHAQYLTLLEQGVITLYQDQKGNPVDWQGNQLPDAFLITELIDILG